MPILSIIVPVYNVEKYLDNCIQSIINQTFQDWEMILVDDGSTDDSGRICDKYQSKDKRIRVIHQKNKGLSGARNTGIDNSRCEFLTFIDSDDDITPDTYGENIKILEKHPEIDFLQYPTYFEYGTDHAFLRNPDKQIISGSYNIFMNWHNAHPITKSSWNKIYRKHVFANNRFPVGHLHEDFLFFLETMPSINSIYISNIGCYHYYTRNTSILHSPNLQKDKDWVDAELEMLRQMYQYPELKREYLPRYMSAARYLMNSTMVFPKADISSQLYHMQNAVPSIKCLFVEKQRAKDIFWYIIIKIFGVKSFYIIYHHLLSI